LLNYGQAHYYARALRHDLDAMAAIVNQSSAHLVARLRCAKPAAPGLLGAGAYWSFSATCAVGLSAAALVGAAGTALRAKLGARASAKTKAF
jgi:hypothetical protein